MFSYGSSTGRAFRKLPVKARISIIGIILIGYAIFNMLAYYNYMFTDEVIDINQELIDNNYQYGSDNITECFCKLEVSAGFGSFYVPSNHRRYRNYINNEGGYYYIAYLEDNSVMAIKVGKHNLDELNALNISDTPQRSSSTITVEGLVHEMELGKNAQKYKEVLASLGIDSDSDIRIRYINLDASMNRGSLWLRTVLGFIVGIMLVFGDIILLKIQEQGKVNKVLTDDTVPEDSQDYYTNDYFPEPETEVPDDDDGPNLFDYAKDQAPMFGEGEDRERTADGKIPISGRNLIK